MPECDQKEKIMDTVTQLEGLLDMDEPWTFILHDPTGASEFKPENDVEIVPIDIDTVR